MLNSKGLYTKAMQRVLAYLLWTLLSWLLGIGYMRILLGPNQVSSEGLGYLFHVFYNIGLLHIGIRIGTVIALMFILIDVFYLKKKLQNKDKTIAVRFGCLLLITIVVTILHYVLEKVIDVI